jgi:two-component system response regulator HydG
MRGKLLIVDAELSVRESLVNWFTDEGYEVTTAENAEDANEALTQVSGQTFDVALVDIEMRNADGIELWRRLHEICPCTPVIIMAAFASDETAIAALKNSAYHYVNKPLDRDETAHLIANAASYRHAQQENLRLKKTILEIARPFEIIGQSAAMRKLFDAIETVAATDAAVLITGENGTGKELVARAIHAASARRYHPLIVTHCSALADMLLQNELFGCDDGAFTGAQYRKQSKFEIADGGTVFLDGVGDISLKTQSDMLRLLQEQEITRADGNQIIKVNLRVIAATNSDLERLIDEGKFRRDLYSRLSVFYIEIPPLRQRREDIVMLADHFVIRFSSEMGKRITGVSPETMSALRQHNWPGNVRELQNAIERAVMVATEPELHDRDFNLKEKSGAETAESLRLDEVERVHILRVLEECGGHQTRTAEILGIDRVTLHHKLKKYGWNRKTQIATNN